ncbi:hypothetical protein T310_7829 [Rasamsonia emersonii CBS 393.64]|uniref:Azaphilone pigments biosynthesis cluster protein L N-terminal domain-containing protein n=1 Tax=Rasamsonia emersonii (strain ATCC 16479 / CBS 393.64 / IMI 116815) TaxID=1408163 RepID=A0A0F4YJ34_RASE3|nr:hypothetical protein T310_7829 [Rasamsonia emersonii CBS 393.64]KKA18219.1 hypothetical protein T310_7829 [Rasamsonia emersonii CBS 393.64]
MTDPFSLASGAVGIISFGLTVCQGIVTYCSSWKDRDKETSNVAKKAEGLRDTLEALRDLIEGGALQNDPVLSDVKDKILACEGGMHELKKKLETCTGSPEKPQYCIAGEIRDEERELLAQLEELVAEFEEKYDELGQPLIAFLEGYWMTRMEEVLSQEPEEDEIRRVRELGVVLAE